MYLYLFIIVLVVWWLLVYVAIFVLVDIDCLLFDLVDDHDCLRLRMIVDVFMYISAKIREQPHS